MIAEIRNFFKTSISEVDSSLKEFKEYFETSNIPDSIIDNSYHILLGEMSVEESDGHILDKMIVKVTIFKKGYNTPQDANDVLYEKAILIKLCALDISKYNSPFIRNVFCNNVTPSFFSSNDNLLIIEMEFEVSTMLKVY